MIIKTFPLGPLETNCYLIHNATEAVVVDPGGEPGALLQYLSQNKLTLTHILNTHLHFDHVYGNAPLAAATGAPILANPEDAYLLRSELGGGGGYGLPKVPPFEYQPLKEGEITLLGKVCRVLHTPGHTLGSLSFYWADAQALFAGDVLFYRSVGRSDFAGGNAATLAESIQGKLFQLPAATVVYPGHGPTTTIGDEQRSNPYVAMPRS